MRGLVLLLLICAAGMAGAVPFIVESWTPGAPPAGGHLVAVPDQLAVLDGDTLRLGDRVVRLAGIAAPARGSACHGDGRMEVDCGSAAANALSALVRGNKVDCTISGHDRAGRPVGECVAGGTPLSATLVREGWARAEASDLHAPEAAARAGGQGMWRKAS